MGISGNLRKPRRFDGRAHQRCRLAVGRAPQARPELGRAGQRVSRGCSERGHPREQRIAAAAHDGEVGLHLLARRRLEANNGSAVAFFSGASHALSWPMPPA